MNLTDFQIAVINDDNDEVNSLLMELDRRTELAYFRKAADNFGFKLLEHRGTAYALRRELASVFGYSGESGLRKLCDRYGIQGVSLGTFGHDVRMYIPDTKDKDRGHIVRDNTLSDQSAASEDRAQIVRDHAAKALGLKRNDSNIVFLGWDGFLLAGARGESEQARKVFAYLLQMERAGRIAGGALTIVKAREHRLKEAERVVNIAVKYGKVPQPLQKKIGQYLDQILDTALSDHGQLCLFAEDTGQ